MKGLLGPALAALALVSTASAQPQLTQLPPVEQLTAPIALFPDPILALILPASTEPWHIRQASQILSAGNDPDVLTNPAWTPAIADLAHDQSLTRWLCDNQAWTTQLGAAFASRPDDVLRAIQDLRVRALSLGTFSSNSHIRVHRSHGALEFLPARNDFVSLPRYDPAVVFTANTPGPYVTWSSAHRQGPWLAYYCNWRLDSVWSGDWRVHEQLEASSVPNSFPAISIAIQHQPPQGREWRAAFNAPIHRYVFAWTTPRPVILPGLMQGAPTSYALNHYRNSRYFEESSSSPTFPGDSSPAHRESPTSTPK